MRLLVMAKTWAGADRRRLLCRRAWFPVEDAWFYGRSYDMREQGLMWTNAPDAYAGLTEKSAEMFSKIRDWKYDFMFLCDDDTSVNMEALKRFAETTPYPYVGHLMTYEDGTEYTSGGGGTLLEWDLVRHMAKAEVLPLKAWDDVWLGKSLKRVGVLPVNDGRFCGTWKGDVHAHERDSNMIATHPWRPL